MGMGMCLGVCVVEEGYMGDYNYFSWWFFFLFLPLELCNKFLPSPDHAALLEAEREKIRQEELQKIEAERYRREEEEQRMIREQEERLRQKEVGSAF